MKMNAIKIQKQIQSDEIHIDGLEKFIGKNAEIIILIDDTEREELRKKRNEVFDIIDNFSGEIEKWSRDELYDR